MLPAEPVPAGKLLLAGEFSYVGPPSGPAVLIDRESGGRARPFPRIEGGAVVAQFLPDGQGGWFVGGGFYRAVTR